jgi:hypothetical protein
VATEILVALGAHVVVGSVSVSKEKEKRGVSKKCPPPLSVRKQKERKDVPEEFTALHAKLRLHRLCDLVLVS